MNKKEKKKLIKSEEKAIREILHKWDTIILYPEDEYDCLIHHIISELHNKASESDIEKLIENEIINHFGIEKDKDKIVEVANKIFNYWKNNSR